MSNQAKYPSRFNPGQLISTDKWLAEFMCYRQAFKKNIQLPAKFWSNPVFKIPWAKIYGQQLIFAKTLLKSYDERAISAALKTPQGKKVYSLAARWFDEIIKVKQQELENNDKLKEIIKQEKENQPKPEELDIKLPDKRPEFNTKKTQLDKLREL